MMSFLFQNSNSEKRATIVVSKQDYLRRTVNDLFLRSKPPLLLAEHIFLDKHEYKFRIRCERCDVMHFCRVNTP